MTAKQYEVIRPFRETNPRSGLDTFYEVGDDHAAPTDKQPHLLAADGPDGRGPLLAEKSVLRAAEKAEADAAKKAEKADKAAVEADESDSITPSAPISKEK